MKRFSSCVLLVAALSAATGCGDTIIDSQGAEADVLDGLGEEANVRVRSVDCPTGVEAQKGADYVCVAQTSLGKLRITYRQLDGAGVMGPPRVERIGTIGG